MREKSRHDLVRDIEAKHLGRCRSQVWDAGRRNLIELMEIQGTNQTCILVKQFEDRVPRGSTKAWPDLAGVWVYVPIEDGDNTWKGLDDCLAAFREAHKAE